MSIPGLPTPDLKQSSPEIVALAKFLRNSEVLKQRPALLGGQRFDMFRGKRAVRALLDPAYKKAQQKNALLPEIPDRNTALQKLALLVNAKIFGNVLKLETEDALAKGMKPQSGVPVVLMVPQPRVGDEEYMIWYYNTTPLMTYVYGVGVVAAFAAIALYQLWPNWARRASYHVSMCSLMLVGVLLGLTVVRLVLFLLSLIVLPKGFWLLPNLYADVGFFESFRPLYAWSGEKTLPVKPKPKKRKSKAAGAAASAAGAGAVPAGAVPAGAVPAGAVPAGAVPAGGGAGPRLVQVGPGQPVPPNAVPVMPQGPITVQTPEGPRQVQLPPGAVPVPGQPGKFMLHPAMQQIMGVAINRAKLRFQQIVATNPPSSPEEGRALQQKLVKEESEKLQQELKASQGK